MKPTFHLLMGVLCALVIGCDDNDPIIPSPGSRYRVQSMSQGDTHYTLLQYDANDRISQVTHGLVDAEFDSVESVFQVIYNGDLIDEIVNVSDAHQYRYNYTNGRLSHSMEYIAGKLATVNDFYYDDAGRVDVWVIRQASEDVLLPAMRKSYQYDASGNTIEMELETYDPVTSGHLLTSTSRFLDFDDKSNSRALFLNFSNPYFTEFKNNARTWRVESHNGSAGETHYEYEYNDEGYTTVQRDLDSHVEIKYKFVSE